MRFTTTVTVDELDYDVEAEYQPGASASWSGPAEHTIITIRWAAQGERYLDAQGRDDLLDAAFDQLAEDDADAEHRAEFPGNSDPDNPNNP